MKVISLNVNGMRSAYRKGLLDFISKERSDIICLQEIKAQKDDLPKELLNLKGYYSFFNPAEKKGYSGVAVYTRKKPVLVNTKLGIKRFDKEGRFLELKYPSFTLLNFYLPHGGRQKENLNYKLEVYREVLKRVEKLKNKNAILIGDFNIAHNEVDLARPRQNRNNIMFTLEERKQIDLLLQLGFVDSFRYFYNEPGYYTWWPYAFQARERNIGWRIDYGFLSKRISKTLRRASIYSGVFYSDHCPIGLNLGRNRRL